MMITMLENLDYGDSYTTLCIEIIKLYFNNDYLMVCQL